MIGGGDFNGLLKPVSPSVHVRLSDRFILLLSACFFMAGWDEFSEAKVWWASPTSKHAAHSGMMLHPLAADFFRGTGLTRKWFAPPIRQNGRERKGEGGLLEGRYLLSLAAVFRISESRAGCIPAIPFVSLLFHLHPSCSRLRWQRFACNYVCRRKQ